MSTRGRVSIDDGVVYGQAGGDGRDLKCDVFTPEERVGALPAVILIHGGGWRTGDRTQLRGYGVLIGREGYVCVAPEYRLLDESPWPACLDDVRRCAAWVIDHADELGIDPDRIAVEGNSAGAHLALLLAADDSIPTKACIAVYPPVHLKHGEWTPGVTPLIALVDDGGTPEIETSASPILNIGPTFPPTKLIHGDADEVVPVEASLRMYEALGEAGVACDLHLFAGQPHAFDADAALGRQLAAEMVGFLQRHV